MEACSLLVNLRKGMQSSSEQPLVGEEHCVTTVITAAKETRYVVTRSRMKTENLAFLESVARQFSSLPIFVDCNKVRKHFEYILYAWMEAFKVCKCKSTADRMCNFTPLSARRTFAHNFAINVKRKSCFQLID